mmetsp:Transcript_22286/g.42321  ORF Transcript_22286/g.42321 Transcript_22286/m.42321 type:complete len:236 (+) Transcript_22286:143-850(+)
MPNHFFLCCVPTFRVLVVGCFNSGTLDLLRRRQETILGQPLVLDNDNEIEVFVTIQLGIDGSQMLFEFGGHGSSFLFAASLAFGTLRQLDNGVGLRLSPSTDASKFNQMIGNQKILNGRWCHVLALGSLENFLGATSDLQTTLLIQGSLVTCTNISVLRDGFFRRFFVFKVSHHSTGTLDLDFSIFSNTAGNFFPCVPNVTDSRLVRPGHVGIIEILRHTISFQQFETQITVPGQ